MANTGSKKKKNKKSDRKERKKRSEERRKSYANDQLKRAFDDVVHRGKTKSQAARDNGVPRTTLIDLLKGRTVLGKNPGPAPFLGNTREHLVMQFLKNGLSRGFVLTVRKLKVLVKQIIEAENIPNKFTKNTPGRTWCRLFFKRYPEFTLKTPEHHSKNRFAVTEESVRRWFANLHAYLTKHGLQYMLNCPWLWYNFDETSCPVVVDEGSAVGLRGVPLQQVHGNSEKETYTASLCFSASGVMAPVQFILPLVRMSKEIKDAKPSNVVISLSDDGWQTGPSFLIYLKAFHQHLVSKGIMNSGNAEKKVILLVDNHQSHLDYFCSLFCEKVGIILYALFPNSTHVLQPADVSVMKPFKVAWYQEVENILSSKPNGYSIKKYELLPALGNAVMKVKRETMIHSFKCTGLQPYNPDAVHYKDLLSKKHPKQKVKNVFIDRALKQLNIQIPLATLELFQIAYDSGEAWKGENYFAGLFDVWCKYKQQVYEDVLQDDHGSDGSEGEDADNDIETGSVSDLQFLDDIQEGTMPHDEVLAVIPLEEAVTLPPPAEAMAARESPEDDTAKPPEEPDMVYAENVLQDLFPNEPSQQVIPPIDDIEVAPEVLKLLTLPEVAPSTRKKPVKRKLTYCLSSAKHRATKLKEGETTAQKERDWQCEICHRMYSQDKKLFPWTSCDSCSMKMHIKCVPTEHKKKTKLMKKVKIGGDYEFECHMCDLSLESEP